jgi:pimeloyl-ACP methyl ester carboxylesterase
MTDEEGLKHLLPSPTITQPIVIFGGFLSFPGAYGGMRDTLAQITGQPVWIVEARSYDWIRTISRIGWTYLLRKLKRTVHQAVRHSTTGKVTLVGHSAGGVMARLYLSPKPFLGHAYGGLDYVDHLITLGSPHYNQRGGRMRRWVDEQYPGAYFAPQVEYTSVAGKAICGNRRGSFRGRWAYRFYERLSGDGNAWGDGLVPVASALLCESRQVTLDGVSHFTGFGGPWYGTAEVVRRWWNACTSDDK